MGLWFLATFPQWTPHFNFAANAAANELMALRWLHFIFGIIWIVDNDNFLSFFKKAGQGAYIVLLCKPLFIRSNKSNNGVLCLTFRIIILNGIKNNTFNLLSILRNIFCV